MEDEVGKMCTESSMSRKHVEKLRAAGGIASGNEGTTLGATPSEVALSINQVFPHITLNRSPSTTSSQISKMK